jgi:hypothetical protein
MAMLTVVGPILLVIVRLGLYDDSSQAIARLALLPKLAGVGAVAAFGYAVIPLAFSAMVSSRRYALALWVAHYLVIGTVAEAIAQRSGSSVGAVDLFVCVKSMTYAVIDANVFRSHRFRLDFATAAASIGIQCAIAIGLVFARVRVAREGGVVGSS